MTLHAFCLNCCEDWWGKHLHQEWRISHKEGLNYHMDYMGFQIPRDCMMFGLSWFDAVECRNQEGRHEDLTLVSGTSKGGLHRQGSHGKFCSYGVKDIYQEKNNYILYHQFWSYDKLKSCLGSSTKDLKWIQFFCLCRTILSSILTGKKESFHEGFLIVAIHVMVLMESPACGGMSYHLDPE